MALLALHRHMAGGVFMAATGSTLTSSDLHQAPLRGQLMCSLHWSQPQVPAQGLGRQGVLVSASLCRSCQQVGVAGQQALPVGINHTRQLCGHACNMRHASHEKVAPAGR
jgi:hypothetical protein